MQEKNETLAPQGEPAAYRVIQKGRVTNIGVSDFESLVTHHPADNARARVVDGVVVNGERNRRHAVISGEIDEIAVGARGGTKSLAPDQVLQKKDFILENPTIPSGGAGVRAVDVPSPFAGYVGRAGGSFGTVDIYDREGGRLLARVLHLDPINVTAGSTIEYGQALGVQSNKGLPNAGKHVHMEVDTAHYQAYESYVDDLVSGRLSMDSRRRDHGIEPRPIVDDGVIRIGESSERVRHVQRHLNELGLRDANGQQLPVDGVYRVSMQAAVLRFQEAQGIPPTGDIDQATLRAMPEPARREADRPDHPGPGQRHGGLGMSSDGVAPTQARHPLHEQAEAAVRRLDEQTGRSWDQYSARMAASAACLAREDGFDRIDHIVLNNATASLQKGENVFVVQGGLTDVTNRVAYMKTQEALSTPVEQSIDRLSQLGSEQALQRDAPTPDAHARHAAHRMAV